MAFKEKKFTKELEELGLSLLDNPDYNQTGAIHMFSLIRDHVLEVQHKNRDAITRLCAEGAWMSERMLKKIKEYDPSYKDFSSFNKKASNRMHTTSPYRTICQVVSYIGKNYASDGDPLFDLCARTIYITKSYHKKLITHKRNYDGRSDASNLASSVWDKKDDTFGK